MSEGDFQILAVAQSDVVGDEQLGSKEKFWFRRDGKLWLFKEARFITTPGGSFPTGEDWAEKMAAEIAHTLNIRAATVELAEFKGKRGCASLNFTTRAQQLMRGKARRESAPTRRTDGQRVPGLLSTDAGYFI